MNQIQKDLFLIIKSAITGEKYSLSENFNLDEIAKIAKKHNISAIVYYGLCNCGVDTASPIMQELFMGACKGLFLNQKQILEIEKITQAFDKANIDYMLLKGTLLKKLYPKPEMRGMGDADILVKIEQYKIIKSVMKELGFIEKDQSDHEYIWYKDNVIIELHKRLIPSYNKDYYAYYGDGWKLATIKNGTSYAMSDEDSMIYSFTHFAKHYRDAGIGIRHVLDLWVYKNNKPNLDQDYLKIELTKLELYDFYLNIFDTLGVWFEGKKSNEKTDLITEFIFTSGVYGTRAAKQLASGVRISKSTKNIKKGKFVRLVFLPYRNMCQKYKFLKVLPFLLPFMWFFRIMGILFKPNHIKQYNNSINELTAEKVEGYQESLRFVGLDFNFKE